MEEEPCAAREEQPEQWPEILEASHPSRTSLRLSGPSVSVLFPSLFRPLQHLRSLDLRSCALSAIPRDVAVLLRALVDLSVVSCPSLAQLCDEVCAMPLRSLVVSSCALTALPEALPLLAPTLRVLDLSGNALAALPQSVAALRGLETLNLSRNALREFPACLLALPCLSSLSLAANALESPLPAELGRSACLRSLSLAGNRLTEPPLQLCGGPLEKRLRELDLSGNPWADPRLQRTVDSTTPARPKPLWQYLARCPSARPAPQKQPAAQEAPARLWLRQRGVEIAEARVSEAAAAGVRPFAALAVLRGLDLAGREAFDAVIAAQDELHRDLLARRTLAAIGTHDLRCAPGPYTLDARPPQDIAFAPLFSDEVVRASDLAGLLAARGDASLGRHLASVAALPRWPVMLDGNGEVLSLPPVINSRRSRVTGSTTDVLVEATSAQGADVCRRAVLALIDRLSRDPRVCPRPPMTVEAVHVFTPTEQFKFPIIRDLQLLMADDD
eukprot:m51a1_g14807 hypothetical protein (501) ;mRNA; r:595241-596743